MVKQVDVNRYEAGFHAGEQASWRDRVLHARPSRPEITRGDYQRGYWDGYMPRTALWACRPVERRQLDDKEEE